MDAWAATVKSHQFAVIASAPVTPGGKKQIRSRTSQRHSNEKTLYKFIKKSWLSQELKPGSFE